jgi:hypothetical protein
LRSLGIGANSLRDFSPDEIVNIIHSIPRDLESLDLHNNNLGAYSGMTLIRVFKAIPQGLFSLNMRNNGLNRYTMLELITLTQHLPKTLLSLDLRLNDLDHLNVAGWTTLFRSLPQELTTLYLSGSDWSLLCADDLLKVLKACPTHLTSLYIDNYSIDVHQCKHAILAYKIEQQITELKALKHNVPELVLGSLRQEEIHRLNKLKNILIPHPNLNEPIQDKDAQNTLLNDWHRHNQAYFKTEKSSTERFFALGPTRPSGKIIIEIFTYLKLGSAKLDNTPTAIMY